MGTYIRFTTVYGTRPDVSVAMVGTLQRMAAGTFPWKFGIVRVRPGSFRIVGTPQGRIAWFATGLSA